MKLNFQSNIILNDEIIKKNQLKKIESAGLTHQTHDSGHKTGTT